MADDIVDRLAMMVAFRRFTSIGAADSRSLRLENYPRMEFVRRYTYVDYVPFRQFLGDVSREFMRRLSVVLHGKLGFYLHDALQEVSVATVARLPAPRSEANMPVFLFFFWLIPLPNL
jgi:hypothetical protein